jgi:hypothetical protein
MEDRWYTSQEKKPGYREIVWGLFRGRDVELVQLALTEKEYEDYFRYTDLSWYSLESEKCKSVTHWRPLIRPDKPELPK